MRRAERHNARSTVGQAAGCAAAVAATVAAGLLRWALDPLLGETLPFSTFYAAATAITYWFGWRPGLVAAVLGFLAADWFFLAPRGSLDLLTMSALARIVVYSLVTTTLIYSIERHRRTSRALAAANESLRQGEERLRAAVEKAAMGFMEMDTAGRFITANERVCQNLGYRPGEILGKTVHDITAPEDQPLSDQLNAELLEGRRERLDYEKRYLKRDGSHLWAHVTVSAVRDAAGRPLSFIGTIEDISQRKQAELDRMRAMEALTQEKEFSDTAINSLPGILYLIDAQKHVRRWNRNLESISGYSAEEITRMTVLDFLAEEDRPAAAQAMARTLVTGEAASELRLLTKVGSKIPFMFTGRRLVFEKQTGFLGIGLDITDRKQAEQALRAAKEDLARANQDLEQRVQQRTAKLQEALGDLEQMSYSMIHDMRAPLRAMHTYAAVLEEECAGCLRPESLDYFRRIQESATRLDHLVTDALNYNKIVRSEPPVIPVEIGTLLRGIIETYPNLRPSAADITVEFNEVVVLGNKSLLTQCFGSLLDNAVKFVVPGVKPHVRVWAETVHSPQSTVHSPEAVRSQEAATAKQAPRTASLPPSALAPRPSPPSVRIWIEDKGLGIPQDAQQKIFGMFQRMHHQSEYPGTGIGLTIVKKAMKRMGGHVGLESEPGKGSRFWIELPGAAVAQNREGNGGRRT